MFAEIVWITHFPIHDPFLHLLTFDLESKEITTELKSQNSLAQFCLVIHPVHRMKLMVARKTGNLLPPLPEGALSSHELIQCHPQGKVVHAGVILLPFQHLWWHVSCKVQSDTLMYSNKCQIAPINMVLLNK